MSIFIQEVLGLLKRNKKKIVVDYGKDYFEFGRISQASIGNPGYVPKGEPFIIKSGDLKCQLLENVVLENGLTSKNFVPLFTDDSGSCLKQNVTITDSIMRQEVLPTFGNLGMLIKGDIKAENAVFNQNVVLGTQGVLVKTMLYSKIIDSADNEAGAANRVLRSLADGRVVWSDDDPVVALPYGNIWLGNAQGIQEPLPPGTASQIIISDGTTIEYGDLIASTADELLGASIDNQTVGVIGVGVDIESQADITAVDTSDELLIKHQQQGKNMKVNLGNLVSSLDIVTGTGNINNVAMFTGDSEIGDGAPVPIVWSGTSDLSIGGNDDQQTTIESQLNIQGPVRDSSSALAGSDGRVLRSITNSRLEWGDVVDGSGTVNKIPLWTPDGDTLGDSIATQSTELITIAGAINVSGTNANPSVFENDGIASNNVVQFSGSARFDDNAILRFGAGSGGNTSDLAIYHSASTGNSIIGDIGEGDLLIHGQNSVRLVKDANGSETYAEFNVDAGVNLYHDNVIKFQTVVAGATVRNGGLTVEGPNGNDGFVNLAGNGIVQGVSNLSLAVAAQNRITITTTNTSVLGGFEVEYNETSEEFKIQDSQGDVIANDGSSLVLSYQDNEVARLNNGELNVTGSLNCAGSGSDAYLYITGNAGNPTTSPVNVQGMAFAYNNSGGSRENEIFFNPGSVTAAENATYHLSIINEYLDSANADARVTDTLLKIYGDGNLELVGPAATSTIANTYWRLPKVPAGNTGMAMLKSAGSIDLEWKYVNTYDDNTDAVPATATSAGTAGQIKFDENYIYVCYADNNWRRAALSTW